MKRVALSLTLIIAITATLKASILLSDSFNYPDGAIVGALGSLWISHSGNTGTALVTNQELEVVSSTLRTEDINAPLSSAPYDTTNNPAVTALYAGFNVRMIGLPSGGGSYFTHFKDATSGGFRCRVFALTNGTSAGGHFRLGIGSTNNASDSAGFATWPADLLTNTTYQVVTRINLRTGRSTLWIDPRAESDLSITDTADPGTVSAITTYAFRQATGVGVSRNDDLRVGTSFGDVAATAPALRVVPTGLDSVQVSWPAAAPGYVLQSTAAISGGWDNYPDQGIPINDRIVVNVANISGSAFFRLSK
jgi:hypothetical protein